MVSEVDLISFNRGIPASEALPSEKVADFSRLILKEDGTTVLQYHGSMGYEPLRKKLANQYKGKIDKDLIFVGNGSIQILDFLSKVMLKQGDTVLVESPTYDRTITIFSRAGARVLGVELEDDGINVDSFAALVKENKPKLFYIIPDFQNPTGVTASMEKREKILEIAQNYNVKVVEDTPYRYLRYYGDDNPSLWEIDSGIVLQLSSFTKILSPGLRIGWLVADTEVIEKISRYAEDTYITPNMLSQGIAYKAMVGGWLESHIENLKSLYKSRLDAILESLDNYMLEFAEWIKPRGGYFVGVWLTENIDPEQVYKKSKEVGLALSSSSGFFPEGSEARFIRLPFCALEPAEIEEGIKRLAKICLESKR